MVTGSSIESQLDQGIKKILGKTIKNYSFVASLALIKPYYSTEKMQSTELNLGGKGLKHPLSTKL